MELQLGDKLKEMFGVVEEKPPVEKNPFELTSISEGIWIAGDGISIQTHRAMLESGVHPNQKLQEEFDKRKTKSTPTPTPSTEGSMTQAEEFEKVMGSEAASRRKAAQEAQRKKLMQSR
jgi:hypothetical protein